MRFRPRFGFAGTGIAPPQCLHFADVTLDI
jgi:hypothetical protein